MRCGFIVINQSLSRLQNNRSTKNRQVRQSLKFCFWQEKWWQSCFLGGHERSSACWASGTGLKCKRGIVLQSAWATHNCNTKQTKGTTDARCDSFAWQRSTTHCAGDCEQPGVRGVTIIIIIINLFAQNYRVQLQQYQLTLSRTEGLSSSTNNCP